MNSDIDPDHSYSYLDTMGDLWRTTFNVILLSLNKALEFMAIG